jgi:predicted glycoside hydrolase/deacetylase ChbG (UPF0249 family)
VPKSEKALYRADDFGSCTAANDAILDVVAHGIVKNVSVMMPGPAVAHRIGELAENEQIDIGLQLTLNSEWDTIKWGPVSALSDVPSLLTDGYFTPNPLALVDRGFDLDEATHELESQFALGRSLGLRFAYVDEHMGVGWIPGLRQRIEQFAARTRLIYAPAPPVALHVFHPCYASAESRKFVHAGLEQGQIAQERSLEAELLLSAKHPSLQLEPIRYRDLAIA